MYYEVYVDTLFLVNFVMNLYLLMLTNISARRTATRLRMIIASAVGAGIYVISLAISFLPPVLELILQTVAALMLMIKIAFRPCTLAGYKKILETLLGYSLFIGGTLYMLTRYMEGIADYSFGIAFIMGAGGLIFMLCSYLAERRKRSQELCVVTLHCGDKAVTVTAILDTGNGLIEPISGKPVCVVNRAVLEKLWPEGLPELFRVVPYHSVGKLSGIMKAYLTESMTVELDGIPGCYEKVYVAVGEQEVTVKGKYEMILNPMVLEMKGRAWEMGGKYDIKSSNAGESMF